MIRHPMKEAVAAALFADEHGEEWDEATENARHDYLHRADLAIRAMDRSDTMNVLHTLATCMAGAMPLLDKAAVAEAHAEQGKPMRKVTHQRRREAAVIAVERAFEIMGIAQ